MIPVSGHVISTGVGVPTVSTAVSVLRGSPPQPGLEPSRESEWSSLWGELLKMAPLQLSYCRSLLPLVFPWTTSHHFVVRLYAQKTVEVLWEAEGPGENPILDSCIHFMRQHRFPLSFLPSSSSPSTLWPSQ